MAITGTSELSETDEAYVVFYDRTNIPLIRTFLKPDFHHCFVLVKRDHYWITIHPRIHIIDLDAVYCDDINDYSILDYYKSRPGTRVVKAGISILDEMRVPPIGLFTCVTMVKRVIGLHKWWIWTPYQLYRYLIGEGSIYDR